MRNWDKCKEIVLVKALGTCGTGSLGLLLLLSKRELGSNSNTCPFLLGNSKSERLETGERKGDSLGLAYMGV
jgi:hypothetical protein